VLDELDIGVLNDLHPISLNSTPRPGRIWAPARSSRRRTFSLSSTDQAKVAILVALRTIGFRQIDELISDVDEGYFLASPSQWQVEQLAIKRQCLINTPDFECDMVDADDSGLIARFLECRHIYRPPNGSKTPDRDGAEQNYRRRRVSAGLTQP
jgi:hypothetical protein